MRRLVSAAAAIAGLALALPGAAAAAPGDLDPSFGDGGHVITGFDPPSPGVSADVVAITADDRIVVATTVGTDESGYPYDEVAVYRYLPDGSLDPSFGNGGLARVDLPGPFIVPGLGVGPAGEVFFVTTTDGPGGSGPAHSEISVAKLDPGGEPDPAFGGGDGVFSFDVGPTHDFATGLALLPDGGVAVSAQIDLGDESDIALARLTPAGALDPGFGSGGVLNISIGDFDVAGELIAYPDGRLATYGEVGINQRSDVVVARFLADGSPDPAFGGNGRKRVAVDDYQDATSIALGPKGGLLAGFEERPRRAQRVNTGAIRLLANGQVDRGFGEDGLASTRLRRSAEYGEAGVLAAAGGKVVVGGYRQKTNLADSPSDFFLARFDRKGELDQSFGDNGTVTSDFGSDSEYAPALAQTSTGEIVLAGSTSSRPGGTFISSVLIARYQD